MSLNVDLCTAYGPGGKWRTAPLLLVVPVLLMLSLFLASSVPALGAEPGLKLVINGVAAKAAPVVRQGIVLVPIRALADGLGVTVGWLPETQTIRLASKDTVIYARVGEPSAMVNSVAVRLPEPPRLIENQTMVPLRFAGEVLGLEVNYNPKTLTVSVDGPRYAITSITYGLIEGRPEITIRGDGPIEFSEKLKGDSLVIELPRARLQAGLAPVDTGNPVVRRLSWEQIRPTLARLTIGLAGSPVYAVERDPTDAAVVRIKFQRQISGAILVKEGAVRRLVVHATGAAASVKALRLTDPDRLALDLEGFTLAAPAAEVKQQDAWVASVRFGQHTPTTVRVVLDTAGPIEASQESGVTGEAAASREGLVFRLLASVGGITTAATKDGTGIQVDLGVSVEPLVSMESNPATLILRIPESRLAASIEDLKPGDGTVTRVRAHQETPEQIAIRVEMPYYAGHQVTMNTDRSVALEVNRSPVFGRRIFLDAGHGGTDPGAVGVTGLFEKDVNLDVAQRLASMLSEAGAVVLLSRSEDVFVPLYERPRLANAQNADIFVSIHSNANLKPQEGGTETYHHPDRAGSRALASAVQREMVAGLGLLNRQVRNSRDLVVTREATMPAILAELAFVSNPVEEQLLREPAFRDKAAQAIWRGIQAYFREAPGGDKPPGNESSTLETPAPAR